MEEPLLKYKNRPRNIITIIYWLSIALSAILVLIYSNLISNSISIILFGIIVSLFLYPTKILKTHIYIDTIVFKEWGWHPLMKNEFGVAFENIDDYEIKRIAFSFYRFVIKKKNRKTIRKLLCFSDNELFNFSKILNERININKKASA